MKKRVVTVQKNLVSGYTDITAPEIVQVQVSVDRKVLWVNVDGICLFRACRIGKLQVDDQSKKGKENAQRS